MKNNEKRNRLSPGNKQSPLLLFTYINNEFVKHFSSRLTIKVQKVADFRKISFSHKFFKKKTIVLYFEFG